MLPDYDYDVDWDGLMFCAVKAMQTPKSEHRKAYLKFLTQNVERVKIEYGPDA